MDRILVCLFIINQDEISFGEVFGKQEIGTFPILREQRVGKIIVKQVEVFCYCRSPNDGSPMVRCDSKLCREWYHISYIDMEITKGTV